MALLPLSFLGTLGGSPEDAPQRRVAFKKPSQEAVNFGSDVSTLPALDDTFTLQRGLKVLSQNIARRLTTPRGALPFAPNFGTDVRQWLGAELGNEALGRLKAQIEAECEKDERVEEASVSVKYNAPTKALTIQIALATAQGPFRLVLGITALSLQLLTEEV